MKTKLICLCISFENPNEIAFEKEEEAIRFRQDNEKYSWSNIKYYYPSLI